MEIRRDLSGLTLSERTKVTFANLDEHRVFAHASPAFSREFWRASNVFMVSPVRYLMPRFPEADTYPRQFNISFGALGHAAIMLDAWSQMPNHLPFEGEEVYGPVIRTAVANFFGGTAPQAA